MIEEATVDAYTEDEQSTGLFTLLEEHLASPFTTAVLGVEVIVRGIDLTPDGRIVAMCTGGRVRQSIGILELSLPSPLPRARSGPRRTVTGPVEAGHLSLHTEPARR
ncbi:calcium-binding protein [Streptomyces bikiniensis]|uniref:calcium-binding protein n=1 Tax=Streptomyces bikiniensis TaxID=1896 RepID=UPI000A9E8B3B|nr:calcium-binding protein [Streptomyces bikiniensis]